MKTKIKTKYFDENKTDENKTFSDENKTFSDEDKDISRFSNLHYCTFNKFFSSFFYFTSNAYTSRYICVATTWQSSFHQISITTPDGMGLGIFFSSFTNTPSNKLILDCKLHCFAKRKKFTEKYQCYSVFLIVWKGFRLSGLQFYRKETPHWRFLQNSQENTYVGVSF